MTDKNPCQFSILERTVDPLVSLIRILLSETFFFENEKWIGRIGNFSAILSAISILIIGCRTAIKDDSFNVFLISIAGFLMVLLVQYVAIKFVEPTIKSIKNIQTSVSDESVLDIIALLFFLSGIIAFCTSVYFAIKFDNFKLFLIGVGVFFSTCYAACLYINPKLVNIVVVESQGPAEDAIGICSSIIKVSSRLSVIAFGITIAIGTMLLIKGMIDLFNDKVYMYEIFGSLWILGAGLTYPIISYFSFILVMLNFQLLSTVLKITHYLRAIAVLLRNSKR
jgi:hypothetical protein